MNLKSKILIIVFLICGLLVFYACFVIEFQIAYTSNPIEYKTSINLFEDISTYIEDTNNVIMTEKAISTSMYTDSNYENYYGIIEIPPDDSYIEKAWSQGKAFIAFESFLQSTKEWIVNNKYMITMYYYADKEETQKITFFEGKWVGRDNIVSHKQSLPEESKDKSIYVKYESILGSFLFLSNGNDVRFQNNYLTIQYR